MAKNAIQGLEVINLKEIDKLLSELPVDLQGKIWRSANRKTGKILLDKLKANIPAKYDHLSKYLKIASDKYNISGVLVGVHPDGFLLRWVEFGTDQRETKKGANRGEFKPTPFIGRSLDEAEPEMMRYINEEYGKIINKAIESRIRSTLKKIQKLKS